MNQKTDNKNEIHAEQLLSALNWRYATKKFDNKKLSSKQEDELLQAILLTPTSFGLDPYAVFVVENPSVREELKKASWNQSQVTDASHLLVFAGRTAVTEKDIDEFIHRIAKTRGADPKSLDSLRQMLIGSVAGRKPDEIKEWTKKQAYIALGNALTSCAILGIDACPMEGFDPAAYDKILGLDKKGFAAAALLAVGFRSTDDKYAGYKKVRKAKEELFIRVS